MGSHFDDKFHRGTWRLNGWDYRDEARYFVTINTKNKRDYFGCVHQGRVGLTSIGMFAKKCWLDIPNHFPHVTLDEFVIMPNHIHGILIFGKSRRPRKPNSFGPQSRNLGSVIRGFKAAVTTHARKTNKPFEWQPKYYEKIIDGQKMFTQVRRYIQLNPTKWKT